MPNTIRHKRSSTPGASPAANVLQTGELAVNSGDGRVYTKTEAGTVKEVTRQAASTTNGRVQLAGTTGHLWDTSSLAFQEVAGTSITLSLNTTRLEAAGGFRGLYSSANGSVALVVTHDAGGPVVIGDAQQQGNGVRIEVDDTQGSIAVYGPTSFSQDVFVPLLTCTPWLGAAARIGLQNAAGNRTMTLSAPTTIANNFTLTFPGDAGSANQVLTTNGSGTLSWTTPSSGASVPDFLLFNAGII